MTDLRPSSDRHVSPRDWPRALMAVPWRRRALLAVVSAGIVLTAWPGVRSATLPGGSRAIGDGPAWATLALLAGSTAALFGLFRVGGWLLWQARRLYPSTPGAPTGHAVTRWFHFMNPVGLFLNLYRRREIIAQLSRREVEGRYRGAYLGIIWSMITPLLLLAIYTFVFSVIFNARWRSGDETSRTQFAITLFAGLIAFNVFSECVTRAPLLILATPNYVKRVVFPLEVLPVTVLGSALFHGLVSTGILLLGTVILEGSVAPTALLLPLAALPLIALTLGLSWLLASLGVYFRDTAYAVSIITQMLFFLTPLFYPIEAVPPGMRILLDLNPLTRIVDGFRRVLVWNLPLQWGPWLVSTIAAFVLMLLGYTWFMKTKHGFANVI